MTEQVVSVAGLLEPCEHLALERLVIVKALKCSLFAEQKQLGSGDRYRHTEQPGQFYPGTPLPQQ